MSVITSKFQVLLTFATTGLQAILIHKMYTRTFIL